MQIYVEIDDFSAMRDMTAKVKDVKIVGFDNPDSIEKYKIRIDSVGYSVSEIARFAVDIIVGKRDSGVIIKHSIIEYT